MLSIGRRQRIAPNFILGAIADATGIPSKKVGKIDVYDDYTVVQLCDEDARLTAETMASCRIDKATTEVRLLAKSRPGRQNGGGRREDRRPEKRGGGKPYGRVDGNGRRTDNFQKSKRRTRRAGRSENREGKPFRRGKKDFRKGQDFRDRLKQPETMKKALPMGSAELVRQKESLSGQSVGAASSTPAAAGGETGRRCRQPAAGRADGTTSEGFIGDPESPV